MASLESPTAAAEETATGLDQVSSLQCSTPPISDSRDLSYTLPSDQEGSEEEGEVSEGEKDEVGHMLRATVDELEGALKDTRQLLAARDKELDTSKKELDRYQQQAVREIANKTRLAQALDQSQSHTSQLETILHTWQLELQELKGENQRLTVALCTEQAKTVELERQVVFSQEKDNQIEALQSELEEYKLSLSQQRTRSPTHQSTENSTHIDNSQLQFLKQAIYHLLIDFHAEEQLRAILSILDFTAQQRIEVYKKKQEKGGLYR